jgi:hypothetical protein
VVCKLASPSQYASDLGAKRTYGDRGEQTDCCGTEDKAASKCRLPRWRDPRG